MKFHVWPCFSPSCSIAGKTKEEIIQHEKAHGYYAPKQIMFKPEEWHGPSDNGS